MKNLPAIILLAVLSASASAAVDPVPPWPTPVRVEVVTTWPAAPALTPTVTTSVEAPTLTPAVITSVEVPALTTAITASTAIPLLIPSVTTSVEAPALATAITTSTAAPVLTPAITVSTTVPVPVGVQVFAGGVEQLAVLHGQLALATAQVVPPAVPAWLDGWYWPAWRGPAQAVPAGTMPVVVYPASPPAVPHLVAVAADATTTMTPLAVYLANDLQAVAVIVFWEETNHDFRANATCDAPRAQAVTLTVRAARPGLPVWLLCSSTVTGGAGQAAAKVAVVNPDALVIYGLFASAAWETDAVVTRNLNSAHTLAPGKPVYAAGMRLVGAVKDQAVARALRLGWGGVLCEASGQ